MIAVLSSRCIHISVCNSHTRNVARSVPRGGAAGITTCCTHVTAGRRSRRASARVVRRPAAPVEARPFSGAAGADRRRGDRRGLPGLAHFAAVTIMMSSIFESTWTRPQRVSTPSESKRQPRCRRARPLSRRPRRPKPGTSGPAAEIAGEVDGNQHVATPRGAAALALERARLRREQDLVRFVIGKRRVVNAAITVDVDLLGPDAHVVIPRRRDAVAAHDSRLGRVWRRR